MALSIDAVRRRVRLDPRDPDFFNDPYPAYAAIRDAAPAFFWEDYGFWCFARFADVSALLRDRRFGRALPESGERESRPHLEAARPAAASLCALYA
jgi:unspecific monooxygenase